MYLLNSLDRSNNLVCLLAFFVQHVSVFIFIVCYFQAQTQSHVTKINTSESCARKAFFKMSSETRKEVRHTEQHTNKSHISANCNSRRKSGKSLLLGGRLVVVTEVLQKAKRKLLLPALLGPKDMKGLKVKLLKTLKDME